MTIQEKYIVKESGEIYSSLSVYDHIKQTSVINLSNQELVEISFGLTALEAAEALNEIDSLNKLHKVKQRFTEEKWVQFQSSFELSRRVIQHKKNKGNVTSSFGLVQRLIGETKNLEQEHFILITLDTKNQIISQRTLFVGTVNQTIAHPRDVLREAIKDNATCIIIAHCHPSGNPLPSASDNSFTKRLAESAKMVGIPLLDHLILGDPTYFRTRKKDF